MSAAESQWPAWLRRRTGVEFLGPPNLFFARLTIALSLGAILYVGAWNAAKYPLSLGYDAQPNAAYIHVLLDQHHIPRPDQSGEANQPPAYYFLAGIAARLGNEFTSWHDTATYPGFPEASYRGAQIFNVVLVFLTALCVLWLARVVAPDRPWVWAASVGFFAFLPVVSKTEAMLHPENLSMLTSAAALAATTHMLVRQYVLAAPARTARGVTRRRAGDESDDVLHAARDHCRARALRSRCQTFAHVSRGGTSGSSSAPCSSSRPLGSPTARSSITKAR